MTDEIMQIGGHPPIAERNLRDIDHANIMIRPEQDGQDEINTFLETITNLEAFDLKLKEGNNKNYILSKN